MLSNTKPPYKKLQWSNSLKQIYTIITHEWINKKTTTTITTLKLIIENEGWQR